jgi:hypothetical protein
VLIVIANTVIVNTIMTLIENPSPNHRINTGRSAIIGIVYPTINQPSESRLYDAEVPDEQTKWDSDDDGQ